MTGKAFISHSSADLALAEKIIKILEEKGLKCWVAPRDVPYGTLYAASIVSAIRGSSVFILILSKSANRSPHVLNEVERAASNGVPILPFVIEQVHLSDALEFFISSTHWLDASGSDMDQAILDLVKAAAVFFQDDDRADEVLIDYENQLDTSTRWSDEETTWEKDTEIPEDVTPDNDYPLYQARERAHKSGSKYILIILGIMVTGFALYQIASHLLSNSGRLYVRVHPREARIEILNHDGGYDPGLVLEEGRYGIRISHPGYESRQEWIKIQAGQETRVDIDLSPLPEEIPKSYGRLTVRTVPAGAEVCVSGIEADYESGMRLETGLHEIQASHPGYENRTETVTIEADLDNEVFIDLSGPGFINSADMEFVLIPAGTFNMGGPTDATGGSDAVEHPVTISKPFYLEATEVTLGQWKTFIKDMGSNYLTVGEAKNPGRSGSGDGTRDKAGPTWRNPGFPQNDNHPAACISWLDAQDFIKWLNDREGMENCEYRLPTEAEWEYALRIGSGAWGGDRPDPGSACLYGNVGDAGSNPELAEAFPCDDGHKYTAPVKSYRPDLSGIYDLTGNVREWCHDWYEAYPADDVVDPVGPEDGRYKIQRGGSYAGNKRIIRPGYRGIGLPEEALPFNGLRLVRDPCPGPGSGEAKESPAPESPGISSPQPGT